MAFAFLVAVSAGALALPIAAVMDPVVREVGLNAVVSTLFATLDQSFHYGEPGLGFALLGEAFWAILVAVCAAPLALAALVGEIAGVRGVVWYAGASGVLAAASPWILRATHGLARSAKASPLEIRIALLFFLTGALTGAVYWLLAAPRERPVPPA